MSARMATPGSSPSKHETSGGYSVASLFVILALAATLCTMVQPVFKVVLAPRPARPVVVSNNPKAITVTRETISASDENMSMIGVPITGWSIAAMAFLGGILLGLAPLGGPWTLPWQLIPFLRNRIIGIALGAVGGILLLLPRSGIPQACVASVAGSAVIVGFAALNRFRRRRNTDRIYRSLVGVGDEPSKATPKKRNDAERAAASEAIRDAQ
jgi:hypothetical protein